MKSNIARKWVVKIIPRVSTARNFRQQAIACSAFHFGLAFAVRNPEMAELVYEHLCSDNPDLPAQMAELAAKEPFQ